MRCLPPTIEELQALLVKIITRIMRLLTRLGFLIEEQGMTYLAEADRESSLLPLQAASCTYRLALGRRAGQKVLSLQACRETHSIAGKIGLMENCTFSSILASLLGFVPSLDQPIRPGEHLRWNRQTDLFRCLEIDHQLKLGGLLDGKVGRLCALQDSVHEICDTPMALRYVGPVVYETTGIYIFDGAHGRYPVLQRKLDEPLLVRTHYRARDVLTFYVTTFAQSPSNSIGTGRLTSWAARCKIANPRDLRRLLRLGYHSKSKQHHCNKD